MRWQTKADPIDLGTAWEEMLAFDRVPASLADPADVADLGAFRLIPAPGRITHGGPYRDASPKLR